MMKKKIYVKEVVDCSPERLRELRQIAAEAQTLLAQHSAAENDAPSDALPLSVGIPRPEIQDLLDKRMEQITKFRRAMVHNDVFLGDVKEVGEMLRAPLLLDWARVGRAEATLLVRQVLVCAALLKQHGHRLSPALQRVVEEYTFSGWQSYALKHNIDGFKICSSTTAIAVAIRQEIQRRVKESQWAAQ
ncbi:hypothetical protein PINS_up022331 [Pythium insidiosum]|nr:hypothetical protein PINS_up012755 [Pythium insidiosum]GLE10262.1 hypothetical protein PINS_up022331 [Pythium insidiosum]